MIRLLWKELREKRLWVAALIATSLVSVLFRGAFTFIGDINPFFDWAWVACVVAFLMGAGSFAHELDRGAASFLYSRPVTWKKALLAKLIVGLVTIAATCLICAGVYAMAAPPQYARFATLPRLVSGMGVAAMLLGIPYVCGLLSSVALPGLSGATLTFVGAYIAMALILSAYAAVSGGSVIAGGIWYVLPLPFVIAALLTVRFGLTLPPMQRARRYGAVFAIGTICLVIVGAAFPGPVDLSKSETRAFSPDGKYALISEQVNRNKSRQSSGHMIRLLDGKTIAIPMHSYGQEVYWSPTDAAYVYTARRLRLAKMGVNGSVNVRSLAVGDDARKGEYPVLLLPSLDRSIVAVISPVADCHTLEFVEIDSLRKLPLRIQGADEYWWHSNVEVGYTDTHGKRHIVRVVRPEAKQ